MPLTSLYLVSLAPSTSITAFIPLLYSSLPATQHPILVGRPLRWMIEPWISSPSKAEEDAVKALSTNSWDLLLIFPSVVEKLPAQATAHVKQSYSLTVGISSKIISGFSQHNQMLLHAAPHTIPALTGSLDKPPSASSSRDLQLTPDLRAWMTSAKSPKTAPSMLNFLSIHPGKLESYQAYGRAFASDVGSRRGGVAKIVGTVVSPENTTGVWDEIAVAHYPSVWHFADMAMGEDYQAVNAKYRVGALKGTAILCCNELDAQVLRGLAAAKTSKARI